MPTRLILSDTPENRQVGAWIGYDPAHALSLQVTETEAGGGGLTGDEQLQQVLLNQNILIGFAVAIYNGLSTWLEQEGIEDA